MNKKPYLRPETTVYALNPDHLCQLVIASPGSSADPDISVDSNYGGCADEACGKSLWETVSRSDATSPLFR